MDSEAKYIKRKTQIKLLCKLSKKNGICFLMLGLCMSHYSVSGGEDSDRDDGDRNSVEIQFEMADT